MESGEELVEMPSQTIIRSGATFESWAELKDALSTLTKTTHTVFTIKSSKKVDTINMGLKKKKYEEKLVYKSVLLRCKNFGSYTSKSTGLRPNQSTFKIGCKSFISVLADLDKQLLVIDNAFLEHNHDTLKEVVDFYPEVRGLDSAQLDNAAKLMKLRVKPSLLLQHIQDETGKKLVGQDLVNARHAMKRQEREGRSETEDLMHFLKTLENDGDHVVVGTDSEGKGCIHYVFIMHKNMQLTFKKFPEVLLADSTYNTNKNKMPLLLINAMNGHGGTECVAYAFLMNETKETYADIFKEFRNAIGEEAILQTKTVVIDHDMSEISSLQEVLPHVNIQLCSFHVAKSFKGRSMTEKKKEAVREILQKMIYSKSDEEYNELYESLEKVASSEFMTEYFNKYYHQCPIAWTRKSKSQSPSLGNNTSNRNESMNQKIKAIVDRSFEVKECIIHIRAFLMNKANTMAYRRYLMLAKKAYVANCSDPEVQTILDTCTDFAAKFLRSELEESKKEAVKIIYETTLTTCNCYFAKSWLLQCRHIMRLRAAKGLSRFSKELVSQRWLQSYNVESDIDQGNHDNNESAPTSSAGKLVVVKLPPKLKPKGKNEKFKSGLQLGGELAELLSICGTIQYEQRVSFLKEIIFSWRNGQELSLYSKGPSSTEDGEACVVENAEEEEGSLNLPSTIKIKGKPKDVDRTVFTRKKASKLKLPAVLCKGRKKTKKESRLTAIGNRRKTPGLFKNKNPALKRKVSGKRVLESESEDDACVRKPGTKSNRNQIASDSGSESDTLQSEEADSNNLGNLVEAEVVDSSKNPEEADSNNFGNLVEAEVVDSSKYPEEADSNNFGNLVEAEVVDSSKNPEEAETEADIKPTIKNIGFLEIDLVSEEEADVGIPSKFDTVSKSDRDLSHLLNDDNDRDVMAAVDCVEKNPTNPLCHCRPKKPTVRRVAGPNARQPGRVYYSCSNVSKKCKFWRLAESPKKKAQPSVLPFFKSMDPDQSRKERAEQISNESVQFNPADSSYTVKSQKDPKSNYKVTPNSCTCPDKRLRGVLECKHILKIKSMTVSKGSAEVLHEAIVEINPDACCVCKNGEPSHSCVTCKKKVHTMSLCSIEAPGEEEGYGNKRICNLCKDKPSTPVVRKRPVMDLDVIELDSVTSLATSDQSKFGRTRKKKVRFL